MPKRLTFEEAARRVAEKFSDRGITLVEFQGTERNCTVHCPIHGNQSVGTYSNVMYVSTTGCPICGKEQARRKASENIRKVHASRKLSANISGSNNNVVQQTGDNNIATNNFFSNTPDHLPPSGLKPLPIVSMEAALDYAVSGFTNALQSNEPAASFIAPTNSSYAIRMPDNSMSPAIQKDNLLIIEPRMQPQDEDIVLIRLPDGRGIVASIGLDFEGNLLASPSGRLSEAVKLPQGSMICGVVLEVKHRLVSAEQAKSRVNADWQPLVV